MVTADLVVMVTEELTMLSASASNTPDAVAINSLGTGFTAVMNKYTLTL